MSEKSKEKLKDKIKRNMIALKNSESKKYIIFLVIVIPIILFFLISGLLSKKDVNNSLNYNSSVKLLNYNIKVSYAAYNTDTKCFEFTWFMTERLSSPSGASLPKIYSISSNSDFDKFIEYDTMELSSTATRVICKDVADDFDYIRIFFESKEADTVVEDRYDDFGDLIKGYTIEGETSYLEVHIDKKDVQIIDNEYAATSTFVTFENLDEPEDDMSSISSITSADEPEISEVTSNTKTTSATTTISSESITTENPEPVISDDTTTSVAAPAPAPDPVPQNSPASPAAQPEPTTTAAQNTTAATAAPQFVELRGLKLSCPQASNGIVTLHIGDTAQLTPIFTPNNATYKAVSWNSTDSSVATVSDDGIVTATSNGNCIIKCTTTQGAIFEVGIMIKVI